MPSSLDQSKRIGELTTPLGKDVLVLSRFDGSEGLSELFEFRIEASSTQEDLPLKDLLGQPISVKVKTIGGGQRYFTGLATEAQWLGMQDKLFSYRIIVRPWLYLLSHRVNSRIFNQLSVSDIIDKVLKEYGFEFENKISSSPVLEYCVQYQESDLAFVQRLMEQHGITFHFKFTASSHKLVLGGRDTFQEIAGGSREFIPLDQQHRRKAEHFSALVPERQFTSGKVALHDYNFKKATASIRTDTKATTDFNPGDLERYDATGRYAEKSDGDTYAKVQMDSLRALDGRLHASGDVVSAHAGNLVTLTKHPTGSLNKQYLIVRCYHSVVAELYRSGGGGGSGDSGYSGSYELLDSEVNYVPPHLTPCPIIAGPQTAVVAGRGEIDCDKFGRILVSFHWEREGEKSMRCRVAQVWASGKWGGIFIPRVGMEVLVQFLDGNPDRPVVIGTVYNSQNEPPYPLPDKNTIAGWKSESTPGGGGYNEFIFDDTKGEELIRMHAQKDHETKILNDERRDIGNDRTTHIAHDDKKVVDHDINVRAGHKITFVVGASTIVMEEQSITITSPTVTIEAGQKFVSNAGIKSEHSAGGLMQLQATMIKIN